MTLASRSTAGKASGGAVGWDMAHAIVTGGAAFIGSETVPRPDKVGMDVEDTDSLSNWIRE